MIAIILSACMAADPGVCKDFKIPIDGEFDMASCAMYAPPHFAQWAAEHPGWNILRWKCVPASASDI